MQVTSDKHTGFSDELRFIPKWAWTVAALLLVGIPVLFATVLSHDPKAPRLAALIPLGILCGFVGVCYFLLIVYVNRDAGRRGMNRWVWTLLAVFIPNALGIILYFLLRQPLPLTCPHCGAKVRNDYGYCPNCGSNLSPRCPQCQHAVHATDVYCPYCGNRLDKTNSSTPQIQMG